MNHFNKPSIDNKLNTVLVAVFAPLTMRAYRNKA